MKHALTTGTFQDDFSLDQRCFFGPKKSKFRGKTRSLLWKGEFDILSKPGRIFRRIIKVNFWTVQVKIGTVQDNNSTKSSELVGQYMVIFQQIKLNCGYVQVEIGIRGPVEQI
jgi:hypothetical protein